MIPFKDWGGENDGPAPVFAPDDIYKAIADGQLAFDLYRHDIAETFRAVIFRDKAALEFNRRIDDSGTVGANIERLDFSIEVGAKVDYEGQTYTVTLVGKENVVMQHESGATEIELDALRVLFDEKKVAIRNQNNRSDSFVSCADTLSLSPKQLEEALERARLLELAETCPEAITVSKRTLQRHRKAIREAGPNAIDRNLALLSRSCERGNRERKISGELIELIHQIARDVFNTPTGVTQKHAYQKFTAKCQELGLRVCSEKTFTRELKGKASIKSREGKRRAYQKAPIVWYLKLNESPRVQ